MKRGLTFPYIMFAAVHQSFFLEYPNLHVLYPNLDPGFSLGQVLSCLPIENWQKLVVCFQHGLCFWKHPFSLSKSGHPRCSLWERTDRPELWPWLPSRRLCPSTGLYQGMTLTVKEYPWVLWKTWLSWAILLVATAEMLIWLL